MQAHEIAKVFPLLDAEQLQRLIDDIQANGLRHPIVVFENQILDGRNRHKACLKAGVEPTFTDFDGDYSAAVRYVTSENLVRRHLTSNQAALAASRLASLGQGRRDPSQTAAVSQEEAARQLGVGVRTVQRARKVTESGVDELVEAVESNEIDVYTASEVAKLPPEEQKALIAEGPAAVKKAAKVLKEPKQPPVKKPQPEEVLTAPVPEPSRANDLDGYLVNLTDTIVRMRQFVDRLAGYPFTDHQIAVAVSAAKALADIGVRLTESAMSHRVTEEPVPA